MFICFSKYILSKHFTICIVVSCVLQNRLLIQSIDFEMENNWVQILPFPFHSEQRVSFGGAGGCHVAVRNKYANVSKLPNSPYHRKYSIHDRFFKA